MILERDVSLSTASTVCSDYSLVRDISENGAIYVAYIDNCFLHISYLVNFIYSPKLQQLN